MADLTERVARLSPAKRAVLERALLARRGAAGRPDRIPRRHQGEPAPLSFAQRRLWFLDQLQGGSGLYGPRAALHLTGPLDVPALRRAFDEVVARHEILRTTFAGVDGRPVQHVHPATPRLVPVVDLSALGPAERAAAVARVRTAELRRPFDLVSGPLVRAVLLRVAEDDHVLLLALHHIVADGWSYAVLAREVSTLYAAFRDSRRVERAGLAELPVQYADFAAWQREQLDGDEWRQRLAWWRDRLAGVRPVLPLPLDRPRPAVPSHRGAQVSVTVPKRVAAPLRAVTRREGATLFMTLLAAFQVVLHRHSGATDLVVGTTVAGRTSSEVENLVGCFVNTLALRGDLSGEPTFLELLARVRETTLAAYAHQDVPFDRLVEELRIERNTSYMPVFQVMFQLQNMPAPVWELPGVAARELPPDTPTEPFDLSMDVTDTGAELAVNLTYGTDLFDEATVIRLLGHFATLLGGIAEAPERRIADLPMMSPAERHQLLVEWNSPGFGPAARTSATVPIGRPAANTRAYVLDSELRPVPIGVVGELCLAGVQVARGYVGRPGLTAERFVPDPFGDGGRLYRTGDLARWLASGQIEFVGRRDQQVKVRGHRIELGEIEATLLAHPGVRAAAVTLWESAVGDVRLAAHVVGQGPVDADGLRAFAGEHLPAYMVPGVVVAVDELPRTASGKVDRAALVPPQVDEPPPAAPAAHEPLTELLQGIWAEVLHPNQVGPDTDFFRAGGHSLLAVQVMARVRQRLGADLPVRTLFEAPTPAAFARRLTGVLRVAAGPAAGIPRAEHDGPVPVSHAQRRMWFTDQLDRTGYLHNVATILDVDGPLLAGAVRRAVAAVRGRHEPLRTTFRQTGGEVEQLVAPPSPLPVPVVDLSALDPAEAERMALALAEEQSRRRFDLGRGPLLRVMLVRLGPDRHQLVLVLHHIVTDAWSTGLLLDELWECYAAELRGEPARLAPLPVRYTDFARWERDRVDSGGLAELEAYWRRRLAGAPEVLDLDQDRDRPMTPVFRGGTLLFELTTGQTRELVEFGLREGVTPFMTVLAAYLVLLRLRSGASDIVVGANAANRGQVEVERLVGFFTNQLVLRTGVAGADTVRELLAKVRETTLEAYAHQEMPFDRLVELLQPARHLNRPPVFQVEITFQRLTGSPAHPDGLTVGVRDLYGDTSTLDLSLHVVQTESVLRGGLTYNADVFAETTARRMLDQLQAVLLGLPTVPTSTVDSLVAEVEGRRRASANRSRAAAARALFDSVSTAGGRA